MNILRIALLTMSAVAIGALACHPAEASVYKLQQQQNLIGTVTAIDSGRITIKADSGGAVTTILTGDKTIFRRVPPGQTSLTGAETIALADVKVGDRVLVPGGAGTGAATPVRQVIVMASEAIAAKRADDRTAWQSRGVNGRITALDAAKRTITVQTRGGGGGAAGGDVITVNTPATAKISRYAPDSLRSEDARLGSFADLRVGDQIRILGERSSDGKIVTAEEIVAGSVTRAFGTITDINTAANEVVIRNDQSGQTYTVAFGKNSVVRRLPPEVAQNIAQRREQRQQRRAQRQESTGAQTENRRANRENRARDNAGGADRQRAGGFQQLLAQQPAISIGDLKKGDAVMVTGTQGTDATRLTAVNMVVGDAEVMRMMQQRPQGRRNMSPGLPGNVAGGNPVDPDEPR